ncbi:MAG TPA: PGPGW domain-containing protein [Rudaea sp.]|nr:PGPGW domain-containing protein [Rudaea sp.]
MRTFMTVPSGGRFRAHYERMRAKPGVWRAVLAVGGGLILIALGIVMLVTPGPGFIVAAIGAALIAGESLVAAKMLDRIDLAATRVWARWRR